MNEIIITNGKENLKVNGQSFLKLNAIFKKMGFEEVNVRHTLKSFQYCDKMTLFICPRIAYNHVFEVRFTSQRRSEWMKLKGFADIYAMNKIINISDESEPITIDGLHMGDYYPNRNMVIFFYPIQNTRLEMGLSNLFLAKMMDDFMKEIERIKIKKIDVSERVRESLIQHFLQEIQKNIISFKNSINSKTKDITDYRKLELQNLTEIHQLREQIKVLKGTRKVMGENIEGKIAEIKTLPFVKRVGISNLGIRVDFKHIDLIWKKEKLPLGECYCYINPNGLEIKNKTPIEYNNDIYHSPHIHFDNICFGSGKDKAYELLGSLKFKELIYFIYLYLKTYNEKDVHVSLDKWKKCKDNGGTYNSNRSDDDDDEDDEEDY